jgi:hypothetical protein
LVLAIKISQKTDHHSNRNPPGASIATKKTLKYLVQPLLKHTAQSTSSYKKFKQTAEQDKLRKYNSHSTYRAVQFLHFKNKIRISQQQNSILFFEGI